MNNDDRSIEVLDDKDMSYLDDWENKYHDRISWTIHNYLIKVRKRGVDTMTKDSDLCNTPKWLMCHFKNHFDPCPENPSFDGLNIDWISPAFVNPPYSEPLKWIKKAIEQQHKCCDVVLLLKVDPSTQWYKLLIEANAHFCYFNERLRFVHQKNGEFNSSNNFASMLVYLEGTKPLEKSGENLAIDLKIFEQLRKES